MTCVVSKQLKFIDRRQIYWQSVSLALKLNLENSSYNM
jgi:hypothetical protein